MHVLFFFLALLIILTSWEIPTALQGGGIYLGSTQNSNAGVFVVVLDGVQTKIDGFSDTNEDSCSLTYSKTGLAAGIHNLTISYVGPSPQAPTASDGTFQLNSIQYVSFALISYSLI
jgi:hypothetical protein